MNPLIRNHRFSSLLITAGATLLIGVAQAQVPPPPPAPAPAAVKVAAPPADAVAPAVQIKAQFNVVVQGKAAAPAPAEPAAPAPTPVTAPAPAPAPAQPTGPTLVLVDGGFASGAIKDSDKAGVVRWQASAFSTPFDFRINDVQSIRFPMPDGAPRATGVFGFELNGGDVLYGSLLALDDRTAELEIPHLGRLKVDRSRLQRLFRWQDGAALIYNGPNGLKGWREFTPIKPKPKVAPQNAIMFAGNGIVEPVKKVEKPETPVAKWRDEGGQLVTDKDDATIQSDVALPAKASLSLEISWKSKPDFEIALGIDPKSDDEKATAEAFRFGIWNNELVVLRELEKAADVAPIQSVGNNPGRAQLQVFLDQEAGSLLVFSSTGNELARLKLGGKAGLTASGIRVTNHRGDLRLERLRISRWDGDTPRPSEADESRVPRVDGSFVQGKLTRFDADSHEFIVKDEDRESRIPQDQLASALLSRSREEPLTGVRVAYQDGTRLAGEWLKLEGGTLMLNVPGIAIPVGLPFEGLRSMEMVGHANQPTTREPETGTLEMDGLRLTGRLAPSGDLATGGRLTWQPIASETASALNPGASGRIIYRLSTPKAAVVANPQAPRPRGVGVLLNAFQTTFDANAAALAPANTTERRSVYLRTGDIIPCEVTRIEEAGVTFKTNISDRTFVPNAKIKAIELATESAPPIKINKAKRDRLLTLPRMQKESPPTHLIRSKNGDILRGRVVAMDDKTIKVEIRLEEKDLARDRVSKIIWLHADETDPSKKVVEPPDTPASTRVQAVRSDGIRLTFAAEKVVDGTIFGKSEVLGDCKVKLQELDQLLIGGSVEKEATQLAYQNWKLQNATEPRAVVENEAGGSGGSAGTEAALVGKAAPDFTLDVIDGPKFHLAENKGKVIVLDFWATWCGPCLQAMPQIEKVTHEFADKGVQLIAVNLQESPSKIKSMLERQKLTPTVALDKDGVVAEKYGANAIPQTVVIDREGKVTRLFVGGGPHLGDQLREALQSLMPTDPKAPAKPATPNP